MPFFRELIRNSSSPVDEEENLEIYREVLIEIGLPMDSDSWWVRFPKRAVEEIVKMHDNTSASLDVQDGTLVWEEVISTNFGTPVLIRIEAGPGYPFAQPEAFTPEISGKKHQFSGGRLCLFPSGVYSSSMSILNIRNLACSWCFCHETDANVGEWPGAEAD